MLILLGETVAFGSWRMLLWGVVFFVLNATYIPLVEEPGLERRFGYTQNVPRWVPRTTAWRPAADSGSDPEAR